MDKKVKREKGPEKLKILKPISRAVGEKEGRPEG